MFKKPILFLFLALFLTPNLLKSEESYQYLNRDNFKIAYRVFGKGKPVVFINGGPGRSSKYSLEIAEKLAKNFQIVLFDQRGVGHSKIESINDKNINITSMIEDLEHLRKKLNYKKFAIVGHSFGGAYAQAYAAKYPKNIEKLVLTSSIGIDVKAKEGTLANMLSRLSDDDKEKYKFWTSSEQRKKDYLKASKEALRLVTKTYVYEQKYVSEVEKILLDMDEYNPKVLELVMKSLALDYNMKDAFKNFKAPTLIIACRQDFMGEEIPIVLKENIPGSRLVFLNECSHCPWYDKPIEFYKLIIDFLN